MSSLVRFVSAAALSAASAAELKLTWSDCGGGSTHTTITGFTPATITTGRKTTMTGTGNLDEDVTRATFDLEMKTAAGTVSCKGDASQSKTCNLPLGTGSLTFDAITFPMKKGQASISVDLSLSALLPGALAHTDTKVTAAGASQEQLFCMEIKSAPAENGNPPPSTYVAAIPGSAEPQFVRVGWSAGQCPQGYSPIADASTCIAAANFVWPQTGPSPGACYGSSWKDCLKGKTNYSEVHPGGCSFESCQQMGADVLVFNPNPNPKHVGKDKEYCGYDSLCQKTSTQNDTVTINLKEEKYSLRNVTAPPTIML